MKKRLFFISFLLFIAVFFLFLSRERLKHIVVGHIHVYKQPWIAGMQTEICVTLGLPGVHVRLNPFPKPGLALKIVNGHVARPLS